MLLVWIFDDLEGKNANILWSEMGNAGHSADS